MKTILFVENDQVVVTMYRNRLESAGFSVRTAEDGVEAMKILSQLTPDLVTLDLMLPKLSGADVLKYIRAEPRLKKVPVILFSNAYMTELGDEAVLAGANRRLLKAYSTPATLLVEINELLSAPPVELPPPAPPGEIAAPAAIEAVAVSGLEQRTSEPEPVVPAAAATSETALVRRRDEFLRNARAEIGGIREHCRAYVKAPATPESQPHLTRLNERVQALSAKAAQTDCARIATLLKAFSALLSEVAAKPAWTSPSILQTIAQAADCVDMVLKTDDACSGAVTRGKVLVVDDDLVCNHVMVTSLKRANLEPVSVQNPKEGLRQLQTDAFDAVLLDVNMPEMTGFEVCEQLRRLSHCKTTPVIFVTAYSNFQNRTQGVLSGGDDFITKPVSPLELALKVTIHMLKAHVERGGAPLPQVEPHAELSDRTLQSIAAAQIEQLNGGNAELPASENTPVSEPAQSMTPADANPPMPVSDAALQPAAESNAASLNGDRAAAPAPENIPSPSPTETATSADAGSPTPQPSVELPDDLDLASLTPTQLAEAEFVSAQLASLTAATTETANSAGAPETPAEPDPVPEQVLQPVAAAELDKIEASISSAPVAEWAGAGSEAHGVAAEETVQQPAAGQPEPATIPEAPEALLATTESHNGVAESPTSLSEALPVAGPAVPEPMDDIFQTAAAVPAEEPGQGTPAPTAAAAQAHWPMAWSAEAAAPTSAPTSDPTSSTTPAEPAEDMFQRKPSIPSNQFSGDAEPPAAIAAFLPPTESHNSLAEPAPASAESPATDPGAPLEKEEIIQPSSSVPLADLPGNQSESAAPVEAVSPATESRSNVAEDDALTSEASLIDQSNTADLAADAPQPEATDENVESSSARPQDTEITAATPALLDILDEKLFPPSASKPAGEPEANPPVDVPADADFPLVAASPDDLVETEGNAKSSDAEPFNGWDELNEAAEPQIAESSADAPGFETPHASLPEDLQHDAGITESNPNFDKVVYHVACMMYGDDNVTKMNLRLVRLALEHYKVHELVIKP